MKSILTVAVLLVLLAVFPDAAKSQGRSGGGNGNPPTDTSGAVQIVDSTGKTVGRAISVGVAVSVNGLVLAFQLREHDSSMGFDWDRRYLVMTFATPNCTGQPYLLNSMTVGGSRPISTQRIGNQWVAYYARIDRVNFTMRSWLYEDGSCRTDSPNGGTIPLPWDTLGYPVDQQLSLDALGIAPFFYR